MAPKMKKKKEETKTETDYLKRNGPGDSL